MVWLILINQEMLFRYVVSVGVWFRYLILP